MLLRSCVFAVLCVAAAGAQAPPAAGVISLSVDLRDAPKKILHSTETIPVTPGELTLVFPKWIPGEHGPTGPIDDQAGFFITGNGQSIRWQRDPVEMYSYHLTVPAGVSSLQVKMDYLATPNGGSFTAGGSTSASLAVLSWNTLLVYPYTGPGTDAKTIRFAPSITLPAGWRFGTALQPAGAPTGDTTAFQPVSLETLIDSPVLSGRFFREVELTGDPAVKHYLDMVADAPEDLLLSPAHIAQFSKLVAETGALYRSRHYGSYHFLVTLSDQVAHFGLEHHQSSDDRVAPKTFVDDAKFVESGSLLPHEFTHSWNGKYRRPAGLATPNYQVPMVGDLLWVYEGLTEYLGDVLAARSGIWTPEQYRQHIATVAAIYSNRPGRTWRDLADTARMAQVLYSTGGAYDNWRRSVDFYDEGELVWLDVDTKIRELTGGKKSIDDFVAAFHGLNGSTPPRVVPYTFNDVVAGLNAVAPFDWAALLNDRLTALSMAAPLNGITQGGYRLAYREKPSESESSHTSIANVAAGTWFSLGMNVNDSGTVGDVEVGGPGDKAGFGPGMKIVAVNGRAYTADVLRDAIHDSPTATAPLEFIVVNTGFYSVLHLDYHGGARYPYLERVASVPDRMDEIVKARTK